MTLKVRRMKKYNQRRSTKIIKSYKIDLKKIEDKIQMSVGAFLSCAKEGSSTKVNQLRQEARHTLVKFGPNMQKIADEIGGIFPKRVSDFLSSIDHMLATETTSQFQPWADDSKLYSCRMASQRLEDILLK